MSHGFKIHYNIDIHDDDSGDLFGGDEHGHWAASDSKTIDVGGTTSWTFDKTVDNEVRFRIEMGFSLSSDYVLSCSSLLIVWEGSATGKDEKNRQSFLHKVQAHPTRNESAAIFNSLSLVTGDGGYGKVSMTIEIDKRPLEFKPTLDFILSKVVFKKDYYQRTPKTVDFKLDFNCFGIQNKIQDWTTIELSDDTQEFILDQKIGSGELRFSELTSRLSANLQAEFKENYTWYMPASLAKYSANPIVPKRPNDQGVDFKKWVMVNGANHTAEATFTFWLGHQYELHFTLIMSFHRTLVHHEMATVNHVTEAIRHYLQSHVLHMQDIKNQSMDIEIENKIVSDPVTPVDLGTSEEDLAVIQKGKKVVVLQEGAKGRNLLFKDEKGNVLTNEEFITAIKLGLYPGYHIRKIRGKETAVSDPDQTTANNLG